jgi:hypothetical protein
VTVSCAGIAAGRNVATATRAMIEGNLITGYLVFKRILDFDGVPASYLYDSVPGFLLG